MIAARFSTLLLLLSLLTVTSSVLSAEQKFINKKPVRIGLTPALLHYQHSLNALWKTYLEKRLHRAVEFVQRDNYRETMDLLNQSRIDFAWICAYPFVALKDEVKLLAVPVHQGRSVYRSYLIVPETDNRTRSISDLEGKIFAYADPLSNTGFLAPRFAIKQSGKNPDTFFKRTFFTWSHRNIIEAVANRLVQGGAVDSYVWESLALLEPSLTQRSRIVTKSEEFAFPPFVAQRSVKEKDFTEMQNILLHMRLNKEGQDILKRLNLDGFTTGKRSMYESVAEMARELGEL